MARRAVVDQPLQMAGRGWKHNVDQAIKRDAVKALVELILNSDDSYRQLERRRRRALGVIDVSVDRRRGRPSTIVVRDEAQGMRPSRLDKAAGHYGEATASRSVRGFFGRGLKEAILGLGGGTIETIKDGILTEGSLSWVGDEPRYRRFKEKKAGQRRTGTTITIQVGREDAEIRVPQHENLVESLSRYFSLRDVVTNSRRTVTVTDVKAGRARERSSVLRYAEPVAEVLEDEQALPIAGHEKRFSWKLKRANEPLLTPAEEGALAPGGILITGKKGILALTLLRYSNNENADHFLGRVECEELDNLILADEPLLKQTREVEGVIWTHPFARLLKAAVEERLRPYIEEEARRNKASRTASADAELRKRISSALQELNAMAMGEVGPSGGGKEPFVPENGFGFVPEYAQIVAHKEAALYLRSITPAVLPSGTEVAISCSDECVEVITPSVSIEDDLEHDGLGRAKVLVKGLRVGGEALLSANTRGDLRGDALVRVVSKRNPRVSPGPKPPRGLFDDVRPDPQADPRQRAVVRDRVIWIATEAPTVSRYIGPNFEGARETPEGQVLLAELVAEAFCREVAGERVRRGRFAFPTGGEADAREREFRNLHNKYALRVHELLFPREEARRGRRTADQAAVEAVEPL